MKNVLNMQLPVGIDDFKEVIEGDYLFVDKTLFIKEVISDGAKVKVFTRPKGFGKTFNLSMLYYFLRHDYHGGNLFEGLKISEDVEFCQKHQQQHPVIYISFKDVVGKSYDEAYKVIEQIVSRLYEEHRYLLDDLYEWNKRTFNELLNQKASEVDVGHAIQNLTKYIKEKFKKSPMVLIDDYDAPFLEAYLNGYYKQMVSLVRGMLGSALKDNTCLDKGILMGVIPISAESLCSDLNHIIIYSFLYNAYESYFGFTQEEVSELIYKTQVEASIDSIKEWYGSYQVVRGQEVVHNPFSVIQFLENDGKLESYWINSNASVNEWISALIFKQLTYFEEKLEAYIQKKVIEVSVGDRVLLLNITRREEDFWGLLLHMGYLKIISKEYHDWRSMGKLAIPNKEVGFVYSQVITG